MKLNCDNYRLIDCDLGNYKFYIKCCLWFRVVYNTEEFWQYYDMTGFDPKMTFYSSVGCPVLIKEVVGATAVDAAAAAACLASASIPKLDKNDLS